MKKTLIFMISLIMILTFTLISQAGDMKFPVLISYIGGVGEVHDLYVDNVEQGSWIIQSDFYLPIGASFHPFYEFNFGLRLGGGVGPLMFVNVSGPDVSYFDVPINVHVGYTFVPHSQVSPYIKTGFMYHINTGDYLKSSSPGLYLAGGLDILRTKIIGFGFEVAMDFSEVTFEDRTEYYYSPYDDGYGEKKIKTSGLLVGMFVRF